MKKLLLTLLFFLHITSGFGQDPFYQILDKSKGLASNSVYDIIQDKKGFIWVAHDEGLSRYDGFSFKNFECVEQTSKAGSCIIEDTFGRIWYSNFDGYIYYVENDTMKPMEMSVPMGFTRFGIGKNVLYIIEEKGLRFYDLATLKPIGFYRKDFLHYTSANMVDDAFVIQDTGFYFFEDAKFKKHLRVGQIAHVLPNSVLFNNHNTFPILVNREQIYDYFLCFNPSLNFPKMKMPVKGFFQNYSFTGDYFWASSPLGVYGFDKKGKLIGNDGKPFFSKYNISNVFKDRQGNYWFATLSDGLLFVPNLSIRIYSNLENKPMRIVERESDIMVGNWRGNIQTFDFLSEPKELFHSEGHSIMALYYDKSNKKTFFANRFFQVANSYFDIEQKNRMSLKDIVKVDDKYYAYAISGEIGFTRTYSQKGTSIWDSIFNANPHDYQRDSYSSWTKESVRAKSVAINNRTQQVYYATHRGVYCVSPQEIKLLSYEDKPLYTQKLQGNGERIFCLSSFGKLLELFPNNTFQNISIPSNFKDIKYSNGFLFLIGEKLLYYLDLKDTTNRLNRLDFMSAGQVINDLIYRRGYLIVATNSGLISAPMKLGSHNNFHPPFYIDKLMVNGRMVNLKGDLVFPHNQNEIEISYSILAYNFSKDLPLYYQINDEQWQLCNSKTRSLKLLSLSPGKYQIRFKYDGFEPETNFVAFEINAPYYQKWWFFIVLFLFIALVFSAFMQVRLKQLKEKNRLEMEKVELEKSLGQSMLTAIKSQMNPHFFYNALNTIQSYIYTNDKQKASSYLSKFSKLTRLILEMSEKESVTLTDEIKALLLYLELEKGRFDEDTFVYDLKVEEDLEVELIQIPSMMVQPYVENAIKHGLLHKSGKKELFITFKKEQEFLKISVVDNGIGREQSGQINARKKEKWNSFATQANEKRIEILNKGRSQNIGIHIIDLFNESGEASGTSVLISIPLYG